jgi:hypothetical protein
VLNDVDGITEFKTTLENALKNGNGTPLKLKA